MEERGMKKGISLIVLVITIVIMIILAGAIILTLVNSGIIGQTREGMIKNNATNYKSELNINLSNSMLADISFNKFLVNAYTLSDIKKYIPSMKAGDETNFAIQAGDLVYVGEDTQEILQMREIGINEGFIIGRTYSKVYINPNPINPDNIQAEANTLETSLDGYSGSGIVLLSPSSSQFSADQLVIKKSAANNEYTYFQQPFIEISKPSEEQDQRIGDMYIYCFSDFEDEGFEFKKGFMKFEYMSGELIQITLEEVNLLEFNFGTLEDEDYGFVLGTEFLHYYFSTVPY